MRVAVLTLMIIAGSFTGSIAGGLAYVPQPMQRTNAESRVAAALAAERRANEVLAGRMNAMIQGALMGAIVTAVTCACWMSLSLSRREPSVRRRHLRYALLGTFAWLMLDAGVLFAVLRPSPAPPVLPHSGQAEKSATAESELVPLRIMLAPNGDVTINASGPYHREKLHQLLKSALADPAAAAMSFHVEIVKQQPMNPQWIDDIVTTCRQNGLHDIRYVAAEEQEDNVPVVTETTIDTGTLEIDAVPAAFDVITKD